MSDKSPGVDFDRQVFVRSEEMPTRSAPNVIGLIITIVAVAAIVVIGYRLLPRVERDAASTGDPALADLDRRLTAMEARLEKMEAVRRSSTPVKGQAQATEPEAAPSKPTAKTVYRISPSPSMQAHAAPAAGPDPSTVQRLSTLQQGLGTVRENQAANEEAWKATTDKLADMSGQVGAQGVEILQSEDELNQLLARTQMEAIPFELLRRSNPRPVGPVSLVLKSSNTKTRRYTLCVYIESTCIELKDRTLLEVVQFVTSRNTTPLEVIATKITKDELLGYLEVPRNQRAH